MTLAESLRPRWLTRLNDHGLAVALALLLLASGIALTPFAKYAMSPLPGYMLAFGTAMMVTNLILASLLVSRGVAESDGATIQLGATYLFVGVIFIPLTAAFPGALAPGALIGTTYSAIWLWTIWHAGFGIGIIRYCVGIRSESAPRTRRALTVAFVSPAVACLLTTTFVNQLPMIFGDPAAGMFSGRGAVVPWTLIAVDAVALVMALGLPSKTPERIWLTVGMVAACFDVWLTFQSGSRFSVGWYFAKVGSLVTTMVVLVSLVNDLSAVYRRVRKANSVLADLANRDGLTHIANRRHFDEVLSIEARRAKRHTQEASLLMIDVDHFKLYNDTYGHQAGDECLRQVAALVDGNARRPGDLAARYGGEEFAVLMPMTGAEGAMAVARRIIQQIESLKIPHARSPIGFVSASIGVASSGKLQIEALVGHADRALYEAKASGRNRAVQAVQRPYEAEDPTRSAGARSGSTVKA